MAFIKHMFGSDRHSVTKMKQKKKRKIIVEKNETRKRIKRDAELERQHNAVMRIKHRKGNPSYKSIEVGFTECFGFVFTFHLAYKA